MYVDGLSDSRWGPFDQRNDAKFLLVHLLAKSGAYGMLPISEMVPDSCLLISWQEKEKCAHGTQHIPSYACMCACVHACMCTPLHGMYACVCMYEWVNGCM
jgi:hypothetical protein